MQRDIEEGVLLYDISPSADIHDSHSDHSLEDVGDTLMSVLDIKSLIYLN